jgi:RimJ/RimL family protein N-acetyltransferase
MNEFNGLQSHRLNLRPLRSDDVAALCAYRSLPEVARYQSWGSFGPDEAATLLASQVGARPGVPGTWLQLAIVVAETGIMVGDCGLHCRCDDPRQMEIGITLDPSYQGLGYATEVVRCLLDFAFDDLGVHRVSAVTDAENASAAALFRRLGFRQEAHFVERLWFKGRWGSEFVFGLLRREWEERKAVHTE